MGHSINIFCVAFYFSSRRRCESNPSTWIRPLELITTKLLGTIILDFSFKGMALGVV